MSYRGQFSTQLAAQISDTGGVTVPKAKAPPSEKTQAKRPPAPPAAHRPRPKPFHPLRRRRPDEDLPQHTGPLAHQRPAPAHPGPAAGSAAPEPPKVEALADRILTGFTARGEATARIELAATLGDFAGAQVDLVAGARGLEVNVMAASAAARRVIQARLTDLHDALARRGVYARKIAVSVRQRDNRGGSRQDGRG